MLHAVKHKNRYPASLLPSLCAMMCQHACPIYCLLRASKHKNWYHTHAVSFFHHTLTAHQVGQEVAGAVTLARVRRAMCETCLRVGGDGPDATLTYGTGLIQVCSRVDTCVFFLFCRHVP